MRKYFLKAGEIISSIQPAFITTILGSCVAVCLWDKYKKAGGMCHYYLPGDVTISNNPNNYGRHAIINLMEHLESIGAKRAHMDAVVLGGGKVINIDRTLSENIGDKNINIALSVLHSLKIPIRAKVIGGDKGRKVLFDTFSGAIKYQEVPNSNQLKEKIKVLIVDDSKIIQQLLTKMIHLDPIFEIVGIANHPLEAKEILTKVSPDVITLDMQMPHMDGLTFYKTHIKKKSVPTIIISMLNPKETPDIFTALEMGAFDYIQKPSINDIEHLSFDLHAVLKAASSSRKKFLIRAKPSQSNTNLHQPSKKTISSSLVLFAASTGGTDAIKEILLRVPANIPPIVIAHHIPDIFLKSFKEHMQKLCPFKLVEAGEITKLEPNCVYLCQSNSQAYLSEVNDKIYLKKGNLLKGKGKFSFDPFFISATQISTKKVAAALLTGLGSDGAKGLLQLKKASSFTVAQNETTCLAFELPSSAIRINAACRTVPLTDIPKTIFSALDSIEKKDPKSVA